jgi:hypothetical protein
MGRLLNQRKITKKKQFYEGGVITDCTDDLDHCVMITGFSDTTGWDGETYHVWNIRFFFTKFNLFLKNDKKLLGRRLGILWY